MSKNISVKINNGNKTIETVKLNSANQKVIIKAQPHVNYELVDEATQYAPEMIDTKRVGNDLHIAFEGTDINKESDLVLEGYYEHDNTELVLGMAEDGQYYAYVPQSGVESDAVTLLADQVFAPQALGGNSVTAPFWAFNPSWLWVAAGVAAVGGIIAAASGSHGGGSSNNANNNSNTAKDTTAPAKPTVEAKDNGSVEVTPPADADTKSVEVSYTDEAGTPKTATLTKGNDGNWTSNNPDVALDPATGKATIPADKVQDGSPVKAKATDESGNTGEEGTANAGNNVDHTVPNAPEVTSSTTDGSVTVGVPSNAKTGDMVEVTITPDTVSGNATPITVTLTKQADGSWTSDNESAVPNVKDGENSSIIPEDKVEDLSKVTVVTKDAMGNTSNKVETIAPLDPAKLSVNEEGNVVLTLPKQVNEGDLIYLNAIGGDPTYYYNEAIGIEFYKTATGWSYFSETRRDEDITKVDEYTYILNNLKPTSKISAQHIEKDAVENFPNNADDSSSDNRFGKFYTISDRTKGSVVSYVIVPPDNVPPGKPTVSSNADGSVNITPPTDKDVRTIEVNYIDENGNPRNAVLTRDLPDGNSHYEQWTSNNPDVKVDKNGEATISADKVKDGSEVTAKATDASGNTGEEGTANAGNNVDHTVPNAPEVTSSTTDGSVTVGVPSNAKTGDMVEVTITPDTVSGNATPITVTLTKQADGSWTSDNESAVPNVKAGENSSRIPEDKVEDLSKVTVVTKDSMGNVSNKVETVAPLDPAKLSVNEEGKVVLTLPKQVNEGDLIYLNTIGGKYDYNRALDIEFYKTATGWDIDTESREPEKDITKVDEYTYILNNLKPTSKISAQHIEKDAIDNFFNDPNDDESLNNGWNNINTTNDRTKGSVVSYLTVPPDNVPPGKPTISTNADGSVNITPPTDEDVVKIEVNYIDENGNPQNAVLTGDFPDGSEYYGSWTSNNPDVKVDNSYTRATITISADKVKDGSEVTAKATDASGNTGDDSIYETGVQHGSNTLDMGSGNDIVRISNDIIPKASIDGGDGFDTFKFVNLDDKPITTTISMISNFEKIDITGMRYKTVSIQKEDVERNHNAKATVDDSGKSHNNVLIVDGNEGDKVNLSEISKTTSSKVTYEGNTYNVYNTGSNELWVDSDITVA